MVGVRADALSDEQLEALLEIVFYVCMGDQELSRQEQRRVIERFGQLDGERLSEARLQRLMVEAAIRVDERELEPRLREAAARLDGADLRRLALDIARDVAGVDGLAGADRGALHAAARALGIAPEESRP